MCNLMRLSLKAKAAGMPLIFELRAMGIPVSEYTPSRGNDKIARVNAVADSCLHSGASGVQRHGLQRK